VAHRIADPNDGMSVGLQQFVDPRLALAAALEQARQRVSVVVLEDVLRLVQHEDGPPSRRLLL
jgi:hypothetical protein